MANGVAAAALAAALTILLPIGLPSKVVMAGTCGLVVASYLGGFHSVLLHVPHSVGNFLEFAATFLGSVGQYFGVTFSTAIGAAGVLIWAGLGLSFVACRPPQGKHYDTSTLTLLTLAGFAIATAAMTAVGRSHMGVEQALSMRYGTFAVVFWVAVLGAAWRFADIVGAWHQWLKPATATVCVTLLVFSYLTWTTLSPQSASHAVMIDLVAQELRAGRFDPDHVTSIYPVPEAIRPAAEFLRANRLSIFAD